MTHRLTLFLFAVGAVGVALLVRAWTGSRDARARAGWSSAITAVIDTTREAGWIETFEAPRSQPLTTFDPRWRPIFGNLQVNARLGAAIGDRNPEDGGDDYAYRATNVPTGSVEIVVDGWWDGRGSIGAEGAVQADPPHRLYEAALWQGKLSLFYFHGPAPNQYEALAVSPELDVARGHYRIVLRMLRRDDAWELSATLRDPRNGYAVVGEVSATDNRLGDGAQGIGILGQAPSCYVTGIAVRAL